MTRRLVGAVLLSSAVAGVPVVASAAPAAAHPEVGIVIAGVGQRCVSWHNGLSGDTILNEVARVSYRSDGVITQIDGQPASNTADDTHYWSYWLDTGSGWRYSTTGPASMYPAAGTLQGWRYVDGQAKASPPPATRFASVCPNAAQSSAHSSAPHSATLAPHSSAVQPVHHATATPTRPAAVVHRPSGSSSRTRQHHQTSAASTTPVSSSASVASSAVAFGTSAPVPTLTLTARPAASSSSSATPAIVAAVVIAALLVAAGLVALRRRSGRATRE